MAFAPAADDADGEGGGDACVAGAAVAFAVEGDLTARAGDLDGDLRFFAGAVVAPAFELKFDAAVAPAAADALPVTTRAPAWPEAEAGSDLDARPFRTVFFFFDAVFFFSSVVLLLLLCLRPLVLLDLSFAFSFGFDRAADPEPAAAAARAFDEVEAAPPWSEWPSLRSMTFAAAARFFEVVFFTDGDVDSLDFLEDVDEREDREEELDCDEVVDEVSTVPEEDESDRSMMLPSTCRVAPSSPSSDSEAAFSAVDATDRPSATVSTSDTETS